jgi:hypothetical protein
MKYFLRLLKMTILLICKHMKMVLNIGGLIIKIMVLCHSFVTIYEHRVVLQICSLRYFCNDQILNVF